MNKRILHHKYHHFLKANKKILHHRCVVFVLPTPP